MSHTSFLSGPLRRIVSAGFVVAAVCGPVAVAEDRVVYTRGDIEVAVSGEASLRRASTTRLALPWPDCPVDPFSCTQDVMYGQVYAIDFIVEVVDRKPDGGSVTRRLDRGHTWVAADLPVDIEFTLDDAVAAYLGALSVASFIRPQTGMFFPNEPLTQETLRESASPAWVCNERDGDHRFDLVVPGEGGERTFSRSGEIARTACTAIANALRTVPPVVYRTMPDVRRQVRREVRLAQTSTLDGLTWADRLAPVPDGVTFKKAALGPDRKTGAIRDFRDGMYIGHEGRYGETERDVRLPAARLDLLEAPMWVARWTFEAVHETFGIRPEAEADPGATVVVAVVPIADPIMDPQARSRAALTVPDLRLVDRTVQEFHRRTDPGPDAVGFALADPEVWPSSGDWLVVECFDDDRARYGIAPFAGAADVTNAQEACAAIVRELDD